MCYKCKNPICLEGASSVQQLHFLEMTKMNYSHSQNHTLTFYHRFNVYFLNQNLKQKFELTVCVILI